MDRHGRNRNDALLASQTIWQGCTAPTGQMGTAHSAPREKPARRGSMHGTFRHDPAKTTGQMGTAHGAPREKSVRRVSIHGTFRNDARDIPARSSQIHGINRHDPRDKLARRAHIYRCLIDKEYIDACGYAANALNAGPLRPAAASLRSGGLWPPKIQSQHSPAAPTSRPQPDPDSIPIPAILSA